MRRVCFFQFLPCNSLSDSACCCVWVSHSCLGISFVFGCSPLARDGSWFVLSIFVEVIFGLRNHVSIAEMLIPFPGGVVHVNALLTGCACSLSVLHSYIVLYICVPCWGCWLLLMQASFHDGCVRGFDSDKRWCFVGG